MNGGDGLHNSVLTNASNRVNVNRLSGPPRLQIELRNSAGTPIFNVQSLTDIVTATGWVCVLASWDLSAALLSNLFLGDVDTKQLLTIAADTIDYTRNEWAIGARTDGSTLLDGCLSQVYLNPKEYIDFSIEENRRKFIDEDGKPVDLGVDGSLPTGTAPIDFQAGATVDWHTNKGTGGGMTENGALTDCGDSPSD